MGLRSGLWAGQSISGTYCPQTIPSQTLLFGREDCHADIDNCHRRTGFLLQTVCDGSECPCMLPCLHFLAVL
jgi:hypothetical protein